MCFQATGVDQAAGMSLVVFSLVLFTYYSVWVIVLVSSLQFTEITSVTWIESLEYGSDRLEDSFISASLKLQVTHVEAGVFGGVKLLF